MEHFEKKRKLKKLCNVFFCGHIICTKIHNNIIFLQYFLCKNLILFKSTMNYVSLHIYLD